MARVLGIVAGLLWIAGMVVLALAYHGRPPGIDGVTFTNDVEAYDVNYFQSQTGSRYASLELLAGTVLVGVAGLLTVGLVLAGRRR